MPRIIDLDVLTPVGPIVRKDGIDYKLPGDPPMELWLAIVDANHSFQAVSAMDGPEARDALQLFHDRLLELFQIEQPDLQELPFGLPGMWAVLAGFYGASLDDDEPTDPPGADEAASTTRTTRGRASSPAKRTRTPAKRSASSPS